MNCIEKFRDEVMMVLEEKIASIRITEIESDVYISLTKNEEKYTMFLPRPENTKKSELFSIIKHLIPDDENIEYNPNKKITQKKLISFLDKSLSKGKNTEILFAYAPNNFNEPNRLSIKKSVATLYE